MTFEQMGMTTRDLIDLAVEYGMVRSTVQFRELNDKQRAAILKQIKTIADKIDW